MKSVGVEGVEGDYVYVYHIPTKEKGKAEKGVVKKETEAFKIAHGRQIVLIKLLKIRNRPFELMSKGNIRFHPSNIFNQTTPMALSVQAKMMPDKLDQSRLLPVYVLNEIDVDMRGDMEASYTHLCKPLIKETQMGGTGINKFRKIRLYAFALMNAMHSTTFVGDGKVSSLFSYEYHIDHWELMDALMHLDAYGVSYLPPRYRCAETYLTSLWKKMEEMDITVVFSPNFVRDQKKYVRNNHQNKN